MKKPFHELILEETGLLKPIEWEIPIFYSIDKGTNFIWFYCKSYYTNFYVCISYLFSLFYAITPK